MLGLKHSIFLCIVSDRFLSKMHFILKKKYFLSQHENVIISSRILCKVKMRYKAQMLSLRWGLVVLTHTQIHSKIIFQRRMTIFFPRSIFRTDTGNKIQRFSTSGCAKPVMHSKIGHKCLCYAFVQNTGCLRMTGEWLSLHSCNIFTGILGHEIHRYMYL